MKKRVICGSAAILLTGLTGAMFTTAAPHAREVCIAPTVLQATETLVIDGIRYTVTTSPVVTLPAMNATARGDRHDWWNPESFAVRSIGRAVRDLRRARQLHRRQKLAASASDRMHSRHRAGNWHGAAEGHGSCTLVDGTVVRIASSSIDAGWHKGRMHLDAQKCWMVKLDKATKDGYTMVALIGVSRTAGRAW